MTAWYADGLRFRCSECGDCCTGARGSVWVNQEEIELMAAFLHVLPDAFEREHVRRKVLRRVFRQRAEGDCIFLDRSSWRCTIYAVRPVQCRTWPFWRENVARPRAWDDTRAVCPGSGAGDLVSEERIVAKLRMSAAARRLL